MAIHRKKANRGACYEGRPCSKDGTTLRYVSNNCCVECQRINGMERKGITRRGPITLASLKWLSRKSGSSYEP